MKDKATAITVAIGLVCLLVLGLLWRQRRDDQRDGQIIELTKKVSKDSLARVAAATHTDSAITAGQRQIDTVTRQVVRWRTLSDTVPVIVEHIVQSTVDDTIKIKALVRIIDTLRLHGDSLARVADEAKANFTLLSTAVLAERAAWTNERNTMATEIRLLKKQSRHWGLGATLGYGVARVQSPTAGPQIKDGPSMTVGLTYRR